MKHTSMEHTSTKHASMKQFVVNLTIKELCAIVEGETSLDPSFLVKHLASLENAKDSDVAVVFDPENNSVFAPLSLHKIKASNAGVILASKPVVADKNYILVKDPLRAIEQVKEFFEDKQTGVSERAFVGEFAVIEDEVTVEPFAVIQDDAKIGHGAHIGANVFIGKRAQIGCNVFIYPGAKILDRCIIGDNSIIHSGAVIGSDGFGYRIMKSGLKKVPHIGIVRLGSDVEIGANTTIDRAEFDETVIGDGVKIDNCVHIAHNVHIGACTAILAHTGIAGSAKIGAGCQIGGQVAIKDHLVIGNRVRIVSKSGVMRNVKDGQTICGIPSMPFSQWKRLMVTMAKLPDLVQSFKSFKKRKKGFWERLFERLSG